MAVRDILKLGNPLLREVSQPISEFDTPELHTLIRDMQDTMVAADGAGLAAIQIGVPLRLMIFGVESNPRYPEAEPVPFTILLNPEYEVLDDACEGGWEGCLSVPGMRGFVSRPAHIRYRGVDERGLPIERVAQGFHARVFQHEFDHLNGVLYPDQLDDPLKFGFVDALEGA